VGPHGIFVWKLMRSLGQCKPIIWSELAPPRALCTGDYRLMWARSSVSATGRTFIDGPIQCVFSAAIGIMWAHAAFSCGSSCACWANAGQLYGMNWPIQGLCAWLITGCCGPVQVRWQGAANSYNGPMQEAAWQPSC